MTLDKDYKVPDGFEKVLLYPDGQNGVPIVGLAGYPIQNGRELIFCIEDKVPKLPFKKTGELWQTGWDISAKYAIDSNNQCWLNNAHGDALRPVEQEILVSEPEREEERNEIRRILGLEIPMPEWAQTAIRAGFIPPPNWNWKK